MATECFQPGQEACFLHNSRDSTESTYTLSAHISLTQRTTFQKVFYCWRVDQILERFITVHFYTIMKFFGEIFLFSFFLCFCFILCVPEQDTFSQEFSSRPRASKIICLVAYSISKAWSKVAYSHICMSEKHKALYMSVFLLKRDTTLYHIRRSNPIQSHTHPIHLQHHGATSVLDVLLFLMITKRSCKKQDLLGGNFFKHGVEKSSQSLNLNFNGQPKNRLFQAKNSQKGREGGICAI